MKKKIKVAQVGLGPIGMECLKLAATKPWLEVIGAIDIDPGKVGADLGELTHRKTLRGMKVVAALGDLEAKPELVFHTAVSRFQEAYEQIEPLVRRGINVVSSCEELLFPKLSAPGLAAKLDRVCRRSGARLVAAGVNPGFVMDFLPVCMSIVSREVRAIHVRRIVNASKRRGPLQRKIGSGLPPQEFNRRLRRGEAGHAGLKESLALLAHALGWHLDRISETGEAIVARRAIRTSHFQVRRGQTCGLHQRAEGRLDGRLVVTLDLKMCLGAENEHDAVEIEGDPGLRMLIPGGVSGDSATVAALVNTAPRLLCASPGLKLVTDLAVAPGGKSTRL